MLEEDVVVLMRATRVRMLGVEAVVAESLDCVHIDHICEIGVIPLGDLLNLMGGAEAVEEVEERHMALDGSKMRYRSEVHDFLDVALGEHGEARLTTTHDIGVVTEDVERMGRERTRAYVEDARQLFAGNLVHVGNHEEQTLGCRIGGGESTRAERAMHRTCSASLGLHLDDLYLCSEDILSAMCRPLIDEVCHGA